MRSRFLREIDGEFGEYWQKSAQREADALLDKRNEIYVDPNGAAKWKSSGHYLPEDVVEKLLWAGADFFSPDATAVAREKQMMSFTEEYINARKNRPRSPEEIAEMRSAFGSGVTIMDVITGESFVL